MTTLPENESTHADNPEIWTVQRVLVWSAPYLKDRSKEDTSNPRLDVELLLSHVLGMDRMKLYLQLDRPLTRDERDSFKILLRRRVDGEPIAYILGFRDFYRHRFKVTPDVLIPRPETEMLVEKAVAAARDLPAPRILDVGTGSGCIAISVAAELPSSKVVAWDISEKALSVARMNAADLGILNIDFQHQDALNLPACDGHELFDVIISNPPYIAADESDIMGFGTLKYEPRLALFAEGQNGIGFYETFARAYQSLLRPGGKIFLEIGLRQGEKVAQLFWDHGWRKIEVTKDLAGLNRMVSAERP